MFLWRSFSDSFKELKQLRTLTVCGLLIALSVVLESVLTLYITQDLKITFGFIPLAAIGMLFGPFVAGISGIICDIGGYVAGGAKGAFLVWMPFVTMLEGIFYGLFLYKLNLSRVKSSDIFTTRIAGPALWSALRIFLSRMIVNFVCYVCLNTFILNAYGFFKSGFEAVFVTRLSKNLILLPIEFAILVVTLIPIYAAYRLVFRKAAY